MPILALVVPPVAAGAAVFGAAAPACANAAADKTMLSPRLRAKMCNFDLPDMEHWTPSILLTHSSRRFWSTARRNREIGREDECSDYKFALRYRQTKSSSECGADGEAERFPRLLERDSRRKACEGLLECEIARPAWRKHAPRNQVG